MQILQNLRRRFFTNMPFRMSLGKLGILLVKVGRILQTRYANWNSEFRLEHQFDRGGRNHVEINLSCPITNESIISFDCPSAQRNKQTRLVTALFCVRGVKKVWIYPYQINIERSSVFSWDELLPDIDRIILETTTAA